MCLKYSLSTISHLSTNPIRKILQQEKERERETIGYSQPHSRKNDSLTIMLTPAFMQVKEQHTESVVG
jgi:hypothetical protein